MRFQWELNAYNIEIEMAEKMGLDDVVEQLLKNLEKERRMIFGE